MPSETLNPKTNPSNSHTEEEWQRKFYAMGAKCHYCGTGLAFSQATKDHRTPKCRGGSSRIWNIVPACLRCNQMKAWRTEAEFIEARPGLCTNAQPRRTKDKPKPSTLSLEQENDPTFLRRVVSEREGVSHWWRSL